MIDKAVIPVAGLGTRIGALARVVPKAMFPLVGADGIIRPVIHCICAEAASAGVSQAIIVVLRQHLRMIRQYFASLGSDERKRLPPEIRFVFCEPLGFGYGVLAGAKTIRNEPFMVFLGDHVHQAEKGFSSCRPGGEGLRNLPGRSHDRHAAGGPGRTAQGRRRRRGFDKGWHLSLPGVYRKTHTRRRPRNSARQACVGVNSWPMLASTSSARKFSIVCERSGINKNAGGNCRWLRPSQSCWPEIRKAITWLESMAGPTTQARPPATSPPSGQ